MIQKMAAQLITRDNIEEANGALAQILLLFVEMAESYSGFGHAADAGIRLDPLKFVDAELERYEGWAPLINLDLLRTGSAIAILCSLYDDCVEDLGQPSRFAEDVRVGKLRHIPDVEAAALKIIDHFTDWFESPALEEIVEPIYHKYVVGYFERLSRMHRRDGGDWPWKTG
jgi:hypothetical protein